MSSQTTLTTTTTPTSKQQQQQNKNSTPYQIDITISSSGKHLPLSKRRIRFRFGFPDTRALAQNRIGTDCRGYEHDVTLVWSFHSGKRLVLADGKEVHYSQKKGGGSGGGWGIGGDGGKFECSWMMGNLGRRITVLGHSSRVKRQFDLWVDGLSIYDMPKIFEIGRDVNEVRYGDDDLIPNETRPRPQDEFPQGYSSAPYKNYTVTNNDDADDDASWSRQIEEHEARRHIDHGSISDLNYSPEVDPRKQPPNRSASMPTNFHHQAPPAPAAAPATVSEDLLGMSDSNLPTVQLPPPQQQQQQQVIIGYAQGPPLNASTMNQQQRAGMYQRSASLPLNKEQPQQQQQHQAPLGSTNGYYPSPVSVSNDTNDMSFAQRPGS